MRGTSFKGDTEVLQIDGKNMGSVTIEGLKAGKKYSFRIRSFVILEEEIRYSNWSDPIKLKIIK